MASFMERQPMGENRNAALRMLNCKLNDGAVAKR